MLGETTPETEPGAPFGASDQVKLGRRIGSGAHGEVYEATLTESGQRVAVKIRSSDDNDTPGDTLLQGLGASHPNLMQVLGEGVTPAGQPYVVTELVTGGSLAELARRDHPLPVGEVVGIFKALASALDQVHSAGILHRDISPRNVLLRQGGEPVLVDFGLAARLGEVEPRADDALGTRLFAPPEVIAGTGDMRGESDIYSLGATIYFLLAGQAPHQHDGDTALGAAHRALVESPEPIPQLAGTALDRVLGACLSKDPDLRPTAKAIIAALEDGPSEGSGDNAEQIPRWAHLVDLGVGEQVTFGRDMRANVVLADDPYVSRQTFVVASRRGGVLVRNVSSQIVLEATDRVGGGVVIGPGGDALFAQRRIVISFRTPQARYQVTVEHRGQAAPVGARGATPASEAVTVARHPLIFTASERTLLAAYCEPLLLGQANPASHTAAGSRLGVSPLTARNRMVSLVQKVLHELGDDGPVQRRSGKEDLCRLVVAAGTITAADFELLP